MPSFIDEMRKIQEETKKKKLTPDQVYSQLNKAELQASLHDIKNKIRADCKNHAGSKTLKGRHPLGGNSYTARIDYVPDKDTGYYRIYRNYLASDSYSDFATGNDVTWLITGALYTVEEAPGLFKNPACVRLTARGKAFLDELKKMCAAEGISVKFGAHAAWTTANKFSSGEVFAALNESFTAKAKLHSVYLYFEYAVSL